ncbi:unnamed protein product [Lepeophtheirus salmonis]|uniref:(salmon louse) hypothetical protein n=1 Tax=Lepeophtheirus salmonis TaxID=72036 RepID=A0A7R8CXJ9_LEPSM|nr:unnamed protein product [Lepeophtheirus salmonis]CAF2960212.1 unnamed protein product [Lepeophtheirus salmonis]
MIGIVVRVSAFLTRTAVMEDTTVKMGVMKSNVLYSFLERRNLSVLWALTMIPLCEDCLKRGVPKEDELDPRETSRSVSEMKEWVCSKIDRPNGQVIRDCMQLYTGGEAFRVCYTNDEHGSTCLCSAELCNGSRGSHLQLPIQILNALTLTFLQNVFQTQIPHSSPRVSKMTQRRQWIKDTCQDLGKEIGLFEFREKGVKTSVRQIINGDNFIRETKTKTIYCFAHKVATSSMFYIYSHIQNDSKFLHEIKMKKKIAFMIKFKLSLPSKDVRRLSSSHYTYLIHRHPYERLISGYLDRIVNNNCSYQAKETYEGVYKKKN